jgi:prophage regulatory protein
VKPLLRRILREPEVLQASGYRKTQLDLLIQQGKFPKPIRLSEGGRARGWFEDEIIAFQEARRAERDAEPKRAARKVG